MMSAAANVAVDSSGVLRHPPPYLVFEYAEQCASSHDERHIAILLAGKALTVKVGAEYYEMF